MSVRFCGRRGVALVGAGCIGLTLLSDLLTAASGSTGIGVINTDDQPLGDRHHDLSLAQDRIGKGGGLRGALAARACRPRHDARRTDRLDRARGQSAARRGGDQRQCLLALAGGRSAQSRRGAGRRSRVWSRTPTGRARSSRRCARSPRARRPRRTGSSINDIILATVSLIDSEILQNHVSLRTELADDVPLVQGDRVQLQQVILNLDPQRASKP